jgi:hypothetical protein
LNAKAIVLILLLAAKASEKTKYIEAALYPMIANAISQYENEVSASELWNLIKVVFADKQETNGICDKIYAEIKRDCF